MMRTGRFDTQRWSSARFAVWFALSAAVAQTGCTSILDFERARRLIERPAEPTIPVLYEGTDASLPGPEGLRAKSGELRVVPLQWEPLLTPNVGGYVIERATSRDGQFERLATVAGAHATSYIDELATLPPPKPPPETDASDASNVAAPAPFVHDEEQPWTNGIDAASWYYRVRAFTNAGELAATPSSVVSATTAAAPEPPSDLQAYSNQPRKVPVGWRASSDPTITGYRIERGLTELGPFETVAEIQGRHATNWTDQALGDLRVFYYRIIAVNAAGGEGPPSKPEQAMTKPEPLPPYELQVTESRLGSNQLTWSPNVEPDVTEYRLLRQRADGSSEIVAALPAWTLEAVDTEVGAGETVSYSLIASDSDGLESAASTPRMVQSEGYGLRATPGAEGVRLQWYPRDDEGYEGARIYRHGILNPKEFPPITGSEFIDSDVEPARRYVYSVVLLDSEGQPAPRSEPVEVTIPADWQPNPAPQH
jgi:fibronectin type 3 domain-containing protein